jgi:hypothetical protein
MPTAKTTDDLLAEVRARVAAPSANGLLSSEEILELADQEMRAELASLLIGVRSEYWLTSYTTSVTANTASYRIPDRSLGMGLRDVTLYDASGNEWNLIQVPADKRYFYARNTSNPPRAFTLENGQVTLLPTPTQSGYTLRLRYYTTPPTLALVSDSGSLTSIVDSTHVGIHSESTARVRTVLNKVDIIRGGGMFDVIDADNEVAGYVASTSTEGSLELDVALTAAEQAEISQPGYPPQAGMRQDYVCISGTTVYPPIPEICWPVLVSATCRAFCEAVGDSRGMEAAAAIFERRKRTALDVLAPRVDGEPVQPVPIDTPLRSPYGVRRWRW